MHQCLLLIFIAEISTNKKKHTLRVDAQTKCTWGEQLDAHDEKCIRGRKRKERGENTKETK